MIGEVVGRYRVLSKIGEGGMGVVYRARDEVLNRDVALKVLADATLVGRLGKDHLLHEARAGSALNHPNICTIYEVFEIDDGLCIAMELVEGKSLSELIGDTGLPIESVLRYGAQIAAALGHAHSRGIVHRDLKSSNVVVAADGLVKVLDFGLARRVRTDSGDEATMTFSTRESPPGGVSGTLFYMPPEVLRGEVGDFRSDVWALGVLLYEAAGGRLPFQGKTPFETSSAIFSDMPTVLPRVPPALWTIIQRCLAKQPAERYQRASEVKAALEAVEAAAITGAQPAGQPRFQTTVARGTRHLRPADGDVLLLVGTTKGAFLLRSTHVRSQWEMAGPYFHGHAVYAMAYDSRAGRHRLWAATHHFWGTFLRSSDDFGRTWTNPL
jgi:serine/threonine protein kinase